MAKPACAYELPDYALRVLDVIESAGYEAWVVGGWVRDAVRGAAPHDVDVCCDTRWEEVDRLFRSAGFEVHRTGVEHGTVTVVIGGRPVEVTTYRVESGYSDLRHPDSVEFVDDVRRDLARRDLTINAMAYHPQRGLLDPFDGAGDLERGIVRAVGDPRRRFGEDALRVLRAVRFACRMGFSVEEETAAALDACAPELAHIARERVGSELDGIVATGRLGWAMREHPRVLCSAIPELGAMVGFEQRSPYHCYDVYEHTMHVVCATEELSGGCASQRLRWASLLHDVGKPRSFSLDASGQGHFFGHPSAGAEMSEAILRGLALPLDMVRPCVDLVRFHDRPVKATRHSVLRMLTDLDSRCPGAAVPLAYETLVLKRADALSKARPYRGYACEVDRIERMLRATVAEGAPYRVRDLAVGGADVMDALGGRPGPWVGTALESCLREVVHGRVGNTREELLGWLVGQRE
ncbi:CCA tRNA nucleotidyltransferase [Atopobiaceae bacterium LCP21S3_F11]